MDGGVVVVIIKKEKERDIEKINLFRTMLHCNIPMSKTKCQLQDLPRCNFAQNGE